MTKDDYVSQEITDILKKKGYFSEYELKTRLFVERPKLQEVARWLRDKRQIFINVQIYGLLGEQEDAAAQLMNYWAFEVLTIPAGRSLATCSMCHSTYEDALYDGIVTALGFI